MSNIMKTLVMCVVLASTVFSIGLVSNAQGQGPGTTPLFNVNVVNATKAFQETVNVASNTNDGVAQLLVPAGKRLVIEHVSAKSGSILDPLIRVELKTVLVSAAGLVSNTHFFVSTPQGTSGFPPFNLYTVSQPVKLYADPPSLEVRLDPPRMGIPPEPLPAFATVTVSGYLLDMPQ